MAKLTAEDLDNLGYSAPDPREKDTKLPSFDSQEEAAAFVKEMMIMGGQGATHGWGDEGIAAIKTGSISSPEYVSERNQIRNGINKIREESPVMSAIAEAGGAAATTAAVPLLRGTPAVKEIISAAVQGGGEADELGDIPEEAGKSALIQTGMEGAGKLIKTAAFDHPTKILSRSMGTPAAALKGSPNAKIIRSIDHLDNAGFFKQGEVGLPVGKHKFTRSAKELTGFFKPQTIDSLTERVSKNLSVLKDRNAKLLANKSVPSLELRRGLYEGIQDLTFDPHGWDVEKRFELAKEIEETFLKDLKYKTGWREGKPIPAADVETAKRSLDKYLKGPAFEKKALDMGIDKQAMMTFREKLDDMLDVSAVGGDEYRKNNDLTSSLLSLQEIMSSKEARDFVDSGTGAVDIRGWKQKLLEGISPTPVDIMRSDVAKGLQNPRSATSLMAKTAKRVPTEYFSKGSGREQVDPNAISSQEDIESVLRGQQSQSPGYGFSQAKPAFRTPQYQPVGNTGMTPMEINKMRIQPTTKAMLENKDLVLAKMGLLGAPEDMIEGMAQALNEDPQAIEAIAPLIAMQYPKFFTDSKYKMFDGKILDAQEAAKAADDTSRRTDIGSIQRAKIIDELNKPTRRWLGE